MVLGQLESFYAVSLLANLSTTPYTSSMILRPAGSSDANAIWSILEPTIRSGETYTLPREMDREQALLYWLSPDHAVFVAEEDGEVLGTYYLRANQKGGGAHVGNCGYMTAVRASGRGVATAMCAHSLEYARSHGFRAMQFNFVVSSNLPAIHLWQKFGFAIVGRLPDAFLHPGLGYVDALVMYRTL
jgi:RimJ/RimL family protein N-acetyltransferase